jgi:signal transduction histidine kinase
MDLYEAPPSQLSAAAEVLESHYDKILATYEERLLAMESPLIADSETREQIRAQARFVLKEVTRKLRGLNTPCDVQRSENQLWETIDASAAGKGVHASESLRAVAALFEATLTEVTHNLPPSLTSRSGVVRVALVIQTSIMDRMAKATIAYTDYLLEKVHEAHSDERRRISRELHDRVTHSMMVVFQNLELYELYRTKDPSKAQPKLEFAKWMVQEALELTRNLSRELRKSSARDGLEVALSDLVRTSVPQEIQALVSVEGDESLIAPQVRDELFLVLREGIRNAAVHSKAKTIKVKLEVNENRVEATVEDDGHGFELGGRATSAGGVGLASMKERTRLLGGNLNLTSVTDEGTRVEVFLPLPRSRR